MNTPYFRGSNEENAMATSPLAPPNTIHATPNRRVLGDVSTNPRVYSSPATGGLFSKKVMMGSPLKRSFTAAVEDGYGLKYLKKRRMSGDMGFGPVEQRVQRARREDHGAASRARSVPEPAATHAEPADELLHSPTEPNTPSDSGGETHESFSSLINYDPSSQHIANPHQTRHQQPQLQQLHPQFFHDHGHAHPPRSQNYPPQQQREQQREQQYQPPPNLVFPTLSHAETLRLRLRVAMYKIRTNQINTPFAELQIEDDDSAETRQHRVSSAVEAAVATMRREAMDSLPKNPYPVPTLIPGPLLYPTAFSSRMIQQQAPEPQAREMEMQMDLDLGPLAAGALFMSDQQAQGANMRQGL